MLNSILKEVFGRRLREIDFFRLFPELAQAKALKSLIEILSHTQYGKFLNINSDATYETFANSVPIVSYEDYSEWIEKSFSGESGIITDEKILWYSKSSGTTSSQSKFLPVTRKFLANGHLQGGRDTLAILTDNYPKNGVLRGKTLTLGGSLEQRKAVHGNFVCGDISAIMMSNTPWYAKFSRTPSAETAVIKDFAQKVERICQECTSQNVTAIAGVPSWNMVMLEKILEHTGKSSVDQVWKNIELFIHGGVSFTPYRRQFAKLFPNPNMKYIETYNASEGFFGIQDTRESGDMLLMADYDIFYEFMPMSSFLDSQSVVPMEGVKMGENYAMIITTSAGLWRYMIGDTVMFTSLNPHRIKITGRTKLFLNVFGEEVVIENCDKAVEQACIELQCSVSEYMVSPVFMEVGERGAHQWIVEFSQCPSELDRFAEIVDSSLQALNSDYQAKRYNSTTLSAPRFIFVKSGAFYKWFESKGKLGGQNKVPRLSNSRELSEEFTKFVETNSLFLIECL